MIHQTNNTHPLAQLMQGSTQYAKSMMAKHGSLPLTYFARTPKGLVIVSPPSLPNVQTKDQVASIIRLVCTAHAATAGILAIEAWIVRARPGEELDPNVIPAKSPRREECVCLLGETLDGRRATIYLPIRRHPNGQFAGFGPTEEMWDSSTDGRFSQLLPTAAPSAPERQRALQILAARGITTHPISNPDNN